MAIKYKVLPDQKIIITQAQAGVSIDEMRSHMSTVSSHPDIHPDFSHLFDLREAKNINFNTNEVKQLAEFSYFDDSSKRAIVASSDLYYGMARMYEIFKESSSANIRVFRTYEEAKEWIGLQEQNDSFSSKAG